MRFRQFRLACTGIAAIACAPPAAAQQVPVEVTFEVPLNLTRLPSRIPKVRVRCELRSSAIIESINVPGSQPLLRNAEVEVPVSQGEVVQAARIIFTLQPQELDNPSGKQASYECELRAYDSAGQARIAFGDSQATRNYSSMNLTPAPAPIAGTFVW